jgi:UDP-N-acetylmuramate-alanine ligase
MSGIAEVLLSHGYGCSKGSPETDLITKRLQKLGAFNLEGQRAEIIEGH